MFLPGESHGQRSLADCSPQGGKELDATEATKHSTHGTQTSVHTCFFPKNYFLCLVVLGLCYCQGLSLVAESGGCSQVMVHGLLTAVASPVAEHGPQGVWASAVSGHEF